MEHHTEDCAKQQFPPKNLIIRLKQQIQQKITQATPLIESRINTKWTTFTYTSPHIRKITNLFKHTNVKIALRCNNTILQLMKPDTKNNTPPHNKSGIYKLTCNTCKLVYVGQTSQNLKLRFQEHKCYIRNNNPQSAYAQHILHNQHEYGPMDQLMTLLKPLNNTTVLIPYEQFFIQSLYQEDKLIPKQYPSEQNPLLQLATDPSYTPRGETSRTTSFTLNTKSSPLRSGPSTHHHTGYVYF